MVLHIEQKKNKSNIVTGTVRGSIYFFGFHSGIKGLKLLIEKNGKQYPYEIHDTDLGFAAEDIIGKVDVWFEYETTDNDYRVELLMS
jgi:hypothetical protein